MLRLRRSVVRGHHLGGVAALVFVAAALTSLLITLVNRTTALREQLARAEQTIRELTDRLDQERADHRARMTTLEKRMSQSEAKEEKRDAAAGGKHGVSGAKALVR